MLLIIKATLKLDLSMNLLELIVLIFLAIIFIRHLAKSHKCRDSKYFLEILNDENPDAPKTLDGICLNIYGEKYTKEEKKKLRELINCNIEPIKNFLKSRNNRKILCLNSKWGSGKTTSLMIAIDEEKNNLKNERFIYESPFKYKGNLNEFIDDFLETLEDTMIELGMITKWKGMSRQLKNNLDPNPKNTFINIIKNSCFLNERLSTELIYEINEKIKKKGTRNTIFVIIDDIDRLHGLDIERILGLLSILRKFVFVKIIIPADLKVICEALGKDNVVEPGKFIEKYLPVYPSVKIKSGFDMVEGIILDKVCALRKDTNIPKKELRPALAAIYLAILSDELAKNYQQSKDKRRYAWLSSNPSFPENMNENATQLLIEAPKALRSTPNFRSDSYSGNEKYYWDVNYNHIGRFQDIIYAIKKYQTISSILKTTYIRDDFTEEDYEKVVESWIFKYMEKRWDIFDFNIRRALDILNSIDCGKISQKGAKQFVEVHNMLFPDRQIKSSSDE